MSRARDRLYLVQSVRDPKRTMSHLLAFLLAFRTPTTTLGMCGGVDKMARQKLKYFAHYCGRVGSSRSVRYPAH